MSFMIISTSIVWNFLQVTTVSALDQIIQDPLSGSVHQMLIESDALKDNCARNFIPPTPKLIDSGLRKQLWKSSSLASVDNKPVTFIIPIPASSAQASPYNFFPLLHPAFLQSLTNFWNIFKINHFCKNLATNHTVKILWSNTTCLKRNALFKL